MKENDFKELIRLQNVLYEEAEKILKEINEVAPITIYEYLEISHFDAEFVYFEGCYGYGDYDNYQIPVVFILDKETKLNFLEQQKRQ